MAWGILVPLPGIESVPPAVEVQSPNYWTASEFPMTLLICCLGSILQYSVEYIAFIFIRHIDL